MTGWSDGLGPWIPVIRGDKLYGRGGADDGYSAFGSLTAIMALQREKMPHARCVVIIEACEESGSYDLPHYIEHLSDRIGTPSLVVCLDSGAGNYDQLWLTVSLRGMAAGTLRADVLKEGVHSGYASGVSCPRVSGSCRQLISRLEDERQRASFTRLSAGGDSGTTPAPEVSAWPMHWVKACTMPTRSATVCSRRRGDNLRAPA